MSDIVEKNKLENILKLSVEDEEKEKILADFSNTMDNYYSLAEFRKGFNEEFKK